MFETLTYHAFPDIHWQMIHDWLSGNAPATRVRGQISFMFRSSGLLVRASTWRPRDCATSPAQHEYATALSPAVRARPKLSLIKCAKDLDTTEAEEAAR